MTKQNNIENTVRKALNHLLDYQEAFEYDEHNEGKWNSLQQTIRELSVIQEQIKK